MAIKSRCLLHKNGVKGLEKWLIDNNYDVQEPKGDFEVLRWKDKGVTPMPIVFYRLSGDHLTVNGSAVW